MGFVFTVFYLNILENIFCGFLHKKLATSIFKEFKEKFKIYFINIERSLLNNI